MVRRIALKQQKFSQSDPVLIRQLKNAVRSRPNPSLGFSPDPVRSSPDRHKRTGRHFTVGAEKICPENNNLP